MEHKDFIFNGRNDSHLDITNWMRSQEIGIRDKKTNIRH